jgi:hypothetical protein
MSVTFTEVINSYLQLLSYKYCEIIINHGVLIFSDFVVHLNHETKNPTKHNFPNCFLPVMFETMNSKTHG